MKWGSEGRVRGKRWKGGNEKMGQWRKEKGWKEGRERRKCREGKKRWR